MKNFYLFILIIVLISFSSKNDDEKPCIKITNKKAIAFYEKAMDNLKFFEKNAYNLFEKAIEVEPKYAKAYYELANINYKKALKFIDNKNKIDKYEMYSNNAFVYFGKVAEYCPSLYNYSSFFYLGTHLYEKRQFEKSDKKLSFFIENFEIKKKGIENYRNANKMLHNIKEYNYLINNPVPFNPRLLSFCTDEDEYLPLITPDGEYFFYTHRYKKEIKNKNKKLVEEFTFSKILEEEEDYLVFSKGESMPFPFNVDNQNQGGASITMDNKHIFLTVCDSERDKHTSYKNCDIYTSDHIDGKWSALKKLGPNINSPHTWEGQASISADGKTLYFASAREGGFGKLDIYYSKKNKNGEWSKAVNLGETINTEGNDKTPFIHSDNRTLYFSSDGRFGLGSFDIFFSRFKNGKWNKPKNIGYPINTENDEVGFVVSRDGKNIYFSSNTLSENHEKEDWEIYSSELHDKVKPQEVLFIKGQIFDENGNALTGAKVELLNKKNKEKNFAMVDEEGNYVLVVETNREGEFIMTVQKKDYFFSTEEFDMNNLEKGKVVKSDIKMKKIKIGESMKLESVHFETDSYELDEISMEYLKNLLLFLNENPKLNIEISGHTDNIGMDANNLILSKHRAKAVFYFLIENAIDKNRLSHKGFGKNKPITTNNTSIGRALNRRTEFKITKM